MSLEDCIRLETPAEISRPQQKNTQDVTASSMSMEFAVTRRDYLGSFRLVHQEYAAQGYIGDPEGRLYYMLHHFLPGTRIYLFKHGLQVVATLTRVKDSGLFGLPMDALYARELGELRRQGRRVVELCAFASCPDKPMRHAVLHMQRSVLLSCLADGVNDVCITVNPRHVSFYERIYHFTVMGEERFYPKVGAPAVAMRLNLDSYQHNYCERHTDPARLPYYGGYRFKDDRQNHPLLFGAGVVNTDILPYLPDVVLARRLFQQRPEVLCNLSTAQREYLSKYYGMVLPVLMH